MCREFHALIPGYAKGELPLYEARRIEAHVEACPECHFRAKALEAQHLSAGWARPGATQDSPSAAAFAALRSRLAGSWEAEALTPRRSRSWVWQWLTVVTLLAIAVGFARMAVG